MSLQRIWTPGEVAEELVIAAETLRKLPPVTAQSYVAGWPEVMHTADDLADQEPDPKFPRPSPADVTRMEQVLGWWRYVDRAEFDLIWQRAHRRPWKAICASLGVSRTTANRDWQYAICKIAWQLNGKRVNPKIGKERFVGQVTYASG